jgi:hypothetical protein
LAESVLTFEYPAPTRARCGCLLFDLSMSGIDFRLSAVVVAVDGFRYCEELFCHSLRSFEEEREALEC